MGSDMLISKSSDKSNNLFKNKTSLILLVSTVLILQVADYLVVWFAGAASSGSVNSSQWTQVDIFVGIFVLFYLGKHFSKKVKEHSSTQTKAEEIIEEQKEDLGSTTSASTMDRQPKRSTSTKDQQRGVSFSKVVDSVEPKEAEATKLCSSAKPFVSTTNPSGLRAAAPEFVSQLSKDHGLRAEAPEFVIDGLRAEAPEFVPPTATKKAESKKATTKAETKKATTKAVTLQAKDADEIGLVLFRSSHSAKTEEAPIVLKSAKKADYNSSWAQEESKKKKEDYNPWGEESKKKKKEDYNPWAQQDDTKEWSYQQPAAVLEKATPQSKWMPNETKPKEAAKEWSYPQPAAGYEKANSQAKWVQKEKMIWKSSHSVEAC